MCPSRDWEVWACSNSLQGLPKAQAWPLGPLNRTRTQSPHTCRAPGKRPGGGHCRRLTMLLSGVQASRRKRGSSPVNTNQKAALPAQRVSGPLRWVHSPGVLGTHLQLSQMQAAEPHSLHAQLHSKGKDEALATLAGSVSTAAAPAVTDVPRGRICTAWPSRFRMSSTGEPRVTVCGLLPSSVPSHRAGQPQACGRGPGSLHSGSVQFPCLHRVTLHLLTHDPLTKVKPRHQDQGHAAGLQAVTAEPLRVWAAPSSQFQGTARISKQLTSQTAVWPLCCFV